MSNQIFVISDTHFGHKKIVEYEKSTFFDVTEHDEFIIANWNGVVKKNDTVWHLGDVLFGADTFSLLPRLNGIKKLVLGNHDRYPTQRYLEYFTKLGGSFEYDGYVFTHHPLSLTQNWRYKGNVHGHTHDTILKTDWHINVCACVIGYTPIPVENILSGEIL